MNNQIHIYADGAAVPNPGEMGCGIVLRYKHLSKEISKYIGHGTNNIAELTAIEIGLQQIKDKPAYAATVFSDSQYAINVLSGAWKAKLNLELIERIKKIMAEFESVDFRWVKGHNGNQ